MPPDKRSHTCGELRATDEGKEVVLCGWVHRWRNHGGVIFVDLRDRYGITQVVFRPSSNPSIQSRAASLRCEWVVCVKGRVFHRPEGMVNPNLETGGVEVEGEELEVLSTSKTPPFLIADDPGATEDLRLKYRYLDLRRSRLQNNLILRHKVYQATRNYLNDEGFLEVETPILTKSTPEGARDYLVPSREHKGSFYALPQSPQMYKQILMVAGFDRYYQIAKCFRDEDLRAERQPEFTQIDIELSFVDEDDIFALTEGLMEHIFNEVLSVEIERPFPRISFADAKGEYGTDKPDIRFGMRIRDLSDLLRGTDFRVFKGALEGEGVVRGINSPGSASFSRKEIDDLSQLGEKGGAKGLLWIKVTPEGVKSPLSKFITTEEMEGIKGRLEAREGDLLLLVAGKEEDVSSSLGMLRQNLAERLNLIPGGDFRFCWVVDFPLFHYSEQEGRIESEHHPFTGVVPEDIPLLDSVPLRVRSRAYDLVLNGVEIGSGSIRIHQEEIQRKIFRILGFSSQEVKERFGFLLEAFQFGVPPHGGIAPGLDRLVMLMAGGKSIREVIAFPKTTAAFSLMDGSPSPVGEDQLKELGIRVTRSFEDD